MWAEEGSRGDRARRDVRARPLPAGAAVLVRGAAAGDRGARSRRGRDGAERVRQRRQPRRRRVPARGRGAPDREPAPARRRAGRRRPATTCPSSRSFSSPCRPPAAASSGGSSASSCCPTHRSSASGRRAPTGGSAAPSPPSPTCARATSSSTRTTASGSCSASRRRRSPASRATTSSSRFRGEDRLYVPHEQLGKVSKYIGADAGAPALSKLGGKAWQNLKARARESVRELATELIALYAQRQQAPGTPYDLEHEWLERLEAEFPYRETEDQGRARSRR